MILCPYDTVFLKNSSILLLYIPFIERDLLRDLFIPTTLLYADLSLEKLLTLDPGWERVGV